MLEDWKKLATEKTQASDLITDFYALLRFLGVHKWDLENQEQAARIGTLARLSQILADFEHVTRRGRWEIQEDGTKVFTGGQDRGEFYYQRLANYSAFCPRRI